MQLTKAEIQCLRDIEADKIHDLDCPFDSPAEQLEQVGLIELVNGQYQLTERGRGCL